MNRDRVLDGASGALWAAIAGGIALVAIVLFFSIGQPFGTINDIALVVMTLSLMACRVTTRHRAHVTFLRQWRAR